jgi:hypothetical protein
MEGGLYLVRSVAGLHVLSAAEAGLDVCPVKIIPSNKHNRSLLGQSRDSKRDSERLSRRESVKSKVAHSFLDIGSSIGSVGSRVVKTLREGGSTTKFFGGTVGSGVEIAEDDGDGFDSDDELKEKERNDLYNDGKLPIRRSSSFRRGTATSRASFSSLPIIGEREVLDTEAIERGERNALIDLFKALEGEKWRRKSSWCSDKPLDEWEGVKCVSGRVEEIKLTNNMLRGTIPESIQNLAMLKRLMLAENFIQGPLPDALGQCSSLEGIWLNDNEIGGELPSGMGHLLGLQQLNLSENSVTGMLPASWKRLSNIESIVLWGNQLSGRLPWVIADEAPMLRYLDMRNNSFGEEDKDTIQATFGAQVPAHNLSL